MNLRLSAFAALILFGCSNGTTESPGAGGAGGGATVESCNTAQLDATFTGMMDYTSSSAYGSTACPNAVVVEYITGASMGGAPGVEASWVDTTPSNMQDCGNIVLTTSVIDFSGATPVPLVDLSRRGAWLVGGNSGIDRCQGPTISVESLLKYGRAYRIVASARSDESGSAATHALRLESRRCPDCGGP